MNRWQPKEIAPKTGEFFLVELPNWFKRKPGYTVVYWSQLMERFQLADHGAHAEDADPSHFERWCSLKGIIPDGA